MHARLPSISGEFRQSVPLTRIRDIARNDGWAAGGIQGVIHLGDLAYNMAMSNGTRGDSYMYALNIGTGALVWKTLTGGSIESSPCVGSDGIVYVGSSDGKLYAFNGATGVIIFSYNIGAGVDSSPAVRVGRVTTYTGLFWIVRRTCHSAVTDPPSLSQPLASFYTCQ